MMVREMEKYLSIGKMAKINHVSVNTLRLYDKWGLLTPCYINEESGYRYYSMSQNATLDLISYMKELGMSLHDIKDVLDQRDFNLIEAILIKKQRAIDDEMTALKRQRSAVDRTIYSLERYRKSPKDGTLTTEYIDERHYFKKRVSKNFYEYDSDTYEMILKEFKDQLLKADLPQVYYCNVGTFLSKENFLKQHFETYDNFIFVDENFPEKEQVQVLESGMYACIYMDDFNKEQDYAKKLLDYCQKQHYEILGDYLCEVLNELVFFNKSSRSMYLRLQVPIAFSTH
jgi:DNA-binding transcriptional MerR regulator